jgi:hypothetical protein
MANDVIRSFLVGLGFRIDEPGLRRFNEQIVKTHHVVRDFSVAFAGFAIGIEEAIRRTARQFENLFYLSQQTGISVANLKNLGFAFGQIGLSAGQMQQTVAAFTSSLMDNPGLKAFVNQYVPGFRNAEDALKGVAARYKDIVDRFGAFSAQASQFRSVLRAMQLDPDMVLRMAQNFEEATKWQQRSAEVLARLGLNADDVARKARDAMNEWRFTWHITDTAFEKIIGDTFPAFRRLLEDFNTWLLKGETVQAFNDIANSIHNWLQDEKNIKAVEDDLQAIGRAAYYVASGITDVVKGFVWLSDNIGPIQTIVLTFFTYVAARAAIAASAVWLLNTALVATGRALVFARGVLGLVGTGGVGAAGAAGAAGKGGLLGILGGLLSGGLAAGAAGLFLPDSQMGPKAQEARKGAVQGAANSLNDFLHWLGRVTGYEDEQGRSTTGTPDTVEGAPKAPVPGARKSSFGGEGGGISITEALFSMFSSWFQGDTAFRPIVVIADEYYTKLVDALRNMTGMQTGHGGTPGSGEGGAATQNVPGRGRGMRGGGVAGAGSAGSGGGATGGVSLAQMKQLALDAGFNEQEAAIMAAVAMHESSGNPRARGGVGELGITQINPHAHGQDLANQAYGNPKRAMEIAKSIADQSRRAGFDPFRPWSSYTGGHYKQYLEEAQRVKPEAYNPQMGGAVGGGGGIASQLANYVRRTGVFGSPEEAAQNLTEVKSSTGETWRVHKLAAPAFQGLLDELEKTGYHPKSSGGYANRSIRGSGSTSAHAYGAAIDIDAANNPLGSRKTNLPANIEEMAAKFGIIWGGAWQSRPDPMHLEWAGGRPLGLSRPLGADGKMSRVNNIDSEHNTTINIHGSTDPQGTARSVADLQDRRSMLHARNLRTSIA